MLDSCTSNVTPQRHLDQYKFELCCNTIRSPGGGGISFSLTRLPLNLAARLGLPQEEGPTMAQPALPIRYAGGHCPVKPSLFILQLQAATLTVSEIPPSV